MTLDTAKPGEVWYRFYERSVIGTVGVRAARCLNVTKNGWYRWGHLECPDRSFCTHWDGLWDKTVHDAMDSWIHHLSWEAFVAGEQNDWGLRARAAEMIRRGVDCLLEYERATEKV